MKDILQDLDMNSDNIMIEVMEKQGDTMTQEHFMNLLEIKAGKV